VAISADTAIVGRPTGYSEAAYIYQRNHGGADEWGEVKKLVASDSGAQDYFGESVAIDRDTVVVGAIDRTINANIFAGAAYIFQGAQGGPNNWGEVKKITASDSEARDQFGASVAVSGQTAIVGARFEDAGAEDAGAAYVFRGLLLGDAGCDGVVDAIDAALVLQLSAGLVGSLACQQNADANGDGTANPIDAALILQFVAGLIDTLGPPAGQGQAMMVRIADGYESIGQLADADICVLAGTSLKLMLADLLPDAVTVSFEDNDTLQQAFIEEHCDAWFGDAGQLAQRQSAYPEDAGGPEAVALLLIG
ncbi:MAG: hypothetical protein IIC89_06350, partial [Chloroflexi bacterium]|nr:hypothetical protein [Chloroflexota bacterium]